MTVTNAFLTHREKMAAASFHRFTNFYIDNANQKIKENAVGFHLGGKAIYVLHDRQQVFAARKVNFYYEEIYNDNPEIQNWCNVRFC